MSGSRPSTPIAQPDLTRSESSNDPRAGPATYGAAGVDLAAGDRAVELLGPLAASTLRPEVIGGLGGFGGLFELDTGRYRRPVLVSSTDGVGTKPVVARLLDRYDTIGLDCVAMCVDDLVCQGAEPLFMLDFISIGRIDPAQVADLVAGVAEGCRQAGAALLGGETAEHPGLMGPSEFDLVGFAVGVVERDEILGPGRVRPGDVLVGLPSPGLRCNGYSLARQVLLERAGLPLDGPAWPGASVTLGEELLRPSVIYAAAVCSAIAAADVHAVAHITGGGFPGNVPRILPDGTRAVLDRGTWDVPRIFGEIRRLGDVSDDEMARVFNLGLGMVVAVGAGSEAAAIDALRDRGVEARVVGRVEAADSAAGDASDHGDRAVLVGSPFWTERGDGA